MIQELYNGLTYETPPQPSKELIAGYNLPKKQQKWKRVEFPENWDEWTQEQQETFAIEEDRKCTDGFWLFINGVETYITGNHYFYLNWFTIDSGFPDYRDRDRRWFYHWELCQVDEECLGQIYGKHRRDGYSYRVDAIILNSARKTFNAKYGIISKTGEDAKEMFNKLVHGFVELPIFFKPQVQSAEDVKKELVFKTPQQRVTFKNRKTFKEISLNTTIDWRNTKENAYDGTKLKIVASDESAKNPKDVSILKWFNIAKTCLILGSRIVGKMLMGSTVNEIEKGGAGFLDIWKNSDHRNKTENGRTISGLWRYFVTAADGLEGFICEYGQSVIETPEIPIMGIDGKLIKKGARQWILDELSARKNAGDMVGYYEFKRQFPLSEDDMFISPANEKTCFDIDKIHQQIEHNDTHVIEKTLVNGYFEWKNGDRDSWIAEWVPLNWGDPRAKHTFSWLPKVEDRNKYTIARNGKRTPSNTHVGLFSLDPYAAVNTTDYRQSKAASHGFKKFDFLAEKNQSDVFIGEYWNRLRDPLLVYDDMIMQCVFFGWALLGERNIKNCNDYFRNRDAENYLLQPPSMTEKDYIDKLGKKEDAGLANTAGKTQQQLVEHLSSYITNAVGYNDKTGEMGYMPFNNTLKDWLEFNVDKWTDYDLTVASMLSIVGSRAVSSLTKKEKQSFNFFPTFKMNKSRR